MNKDQAAAAYKFGAVTATIKLRYQKPYFFVIALKNKSELFKAATISSSTTPDVYAFQF